MEALALPGTRRTRYAAYDLSACVHYLEKGPELVARAARIPRNGLRGIGRGKRCRRRRSAAPGGGAPPSGREVVGVRPGMDGETRGAPAIHLA